MVTCRALKVLTDEEVYFYISRAYAKNRVFVYSIDDSGQFLYLENLSFNISVMDIERSISIRTSISSTEIG